MNAELTHSWHPSPGDWTLSLTHMPEVHGGLFITSTSNGGLLLYALEAGQTPILVGRRAHEASVNAVTKIDGYTLASGLTDGVKIWDVRQGFGRAQISVHGANGAPVLSLAAGSGHNLAAGTELLGADAQIHLWDLKNPKTVVRSFVDSHHDDVTALEFHHTRPYLMSGSTDGYVNVYNLAEPDEEEALHQVINYALVHLCHFTRDTRVAVLSHMETLAFHELNNTNYDSAEEPRPNELGDVRALWPQCEYVVDLDVVGGYVAYGANLMLSLTLVPFDAASEKFALSRAVNLAPAHGDEVVRGVMCVPGLSALLTCGEDGLVKAWRSPTVWGENSGVERDEIDEIVDVVDGEEKREKKAKKEKREKKEKKREKKEKKEKRLKGDMRFKPY